MTQPGYDNDEMTEATGGAGLPVASAGEPGGASPRSGHPVVDAALDDLDDVADLPPADQIAAFDSAYQRLQGALSTIDD